MSVQTELDRIINAVDAAHLKVAEKGGTTARPFLVGNLASAIDTIPEATEPTLQSKSVSPATSAQTVKPDSGYDGLSQVTVNAMPTATQATPSISVSSAGLITASATQSAGYVAAGTKSATKQLTTQGAQTITPGTSDKTIASGRYLTGTQTIKGDSNLVSENIKSGTSIFGVAGSYEGSGGGSGSVETCTVTVSFGGSGSTRYFKDGYARIMYVNGDGVLCMQEVSGTSGLGANSYTYQPATCRCGTPVTVSLGLFSVKSTEQSDGITCVVGSVSSYKTEAVFMLPETAGEYMIKVYYA